MDMFPKHSERKVTNHTNNSRLYLLIPFTIILFISFYIFFTVAHPLYIYDTDDWTYISHSRRALPSLAQWNPTKVLPETLLPFTAELGIRFIMPFTGDYIGSMGYAFAFVISLAIVIYIMSFGNVFREHYGIEEKTNLLMITILALFHFLPFSSANSDNKYLLGGSSVNNIYNYLLPGLINSTVVMYLVTHKKIEWSNKKNCIYNGFLILMLYLCINSNMFHSIILISFVGMNLLVAMGKAIQREKLHSIKIRYFLVSYIKENFFELIILICWGGTILIESRGGRAQWAAASSVFNLPLSETFHEFILSILEMRKLFVIGCVAVELVAIGIYIASVVNNKKGINKNEKCIDVDNVFISWFYKELLCLLLTIVYLVLLCAKVSSNYISNPLVMFSWMFWILLMVFSASAYIMARIPLAVLILPLFLYILVFETVIDGRAYRNNNIPAYDAKTVKELDENIINQVIEAEAAGMDTVEVLVPVHESAAWPIAVSYGGERISTTLYRHGIVNRNINIILVPDYSVNDKFNLP